MTQGFDEFFKENFEDGLSSPSKYMLKFTFEAGAESRQAELDELVDMVKTSADSEMNLFDELQIVSKDRDDLQKRIDEAMRLLQTRHHNADVTNIIMHMYKILKGNNND